MEGEIQKEINKLKYFLEERDYLIQIKDYTEMEVVTKRADKIVDRLSDLISLDEELKMEKGYQIKLRDFNCRQRKAVENLKKPTRGD